MARMAFGVATKQTKRGMAHNSAAAAWRWQACLPPADHNGRASWGAWLKKVHKLNMPPLSGGHTREGVAPPSAFPLLTAAYRTNGDATTSPPR